MKGSGKHRSDFQMYLVGNNNKEKKMELKHKLCQGFFYSSKVHFLSHIIKQIHVATVEDLADVSCSGMPKLMFSLDFMGGYVGITSEGTTSPDQPSKNHCSLNPARPSSSSSTATLHKTLNPLHRFVCVQYLCV